MTIVFVIVLECRAMGESTEATNQKTEELETRLAIVEKTIEAVYHAANSERFQRALVKLENACSASSRIHQVLQRNPVLLREK